MATLDDKKPKKPKKTLQQKQDDKMKRLQGRMERKKFRAKTKDEIAKIEGYASTKEKRGAKNKNAGNIISKIRTKNINATGDLRKKGNITTNTKVDNSITNKSKSTNVSSGSKADSGSSAKATGGNATGGRATINAPKPRTKPAPPKGKIGKPGKKTSSKDLIDGRPPEYYNMKKGGATKKSVKRGATLLKGMPKGKFN